MKLFAAVPTNIASVKEAILNADVKVVLFTTEVEAMEMALECGRRDFHILACEFYSDKKIASSSLYTDAITRAQSDELISYLKAYHCCEKMPSTFEGHFVVCALSQFLAAVRTQKFFKATDSDLKVATFNFCRIVGFDAVYTDSDCTRVEVLNPELIGSVAGALHCFNNDDTLPERTKARLYIPVEANNDRDGVRGFYYAPWREEEAICHKFGCVPSFHKRIIPEYVYLRNSGSNEEECNYQVYYVDGTIAMSPALPWQLYVEGNRDSKPLSDYMAWEDRDFVRIASIVEQYDDGDGEVVFTKVYDREEDMPKLEGCKHLYERRPRIQVPEVVWGFCPAFERQISVNYLETSRRNAEELARLRRLEEARKAVEEDSTPWDFHDDDDIPF